MRVVAFDTETTGVNPDRDRIVEVTLAEVGGRSVTYRVNPQVPIPAAATAVHGIRDVDVAGAPTFAAIAREVQGFVEGAVLLGYNSRSFDTVLLDAELKRAGCAGIDLARVREVDVLRIWHEVEPRTLTGAVRRWLGASHGGAHGSAADVAATLAVWEAISTQAALTLEDGLRLSRPPDEIDRAGKFVLDDDGYVVLTFGKHQGVPAHQVPLDYFRWMVGQDFPGSTKAVVQRLLTHDLDLPEAARIREERQARAVPVRGGAGKAAEAPTRRA